MIGKPLFIACSLLSLGLATAQAQDSTKPNPPAEQKVTLYGFVRNDIYYNSRKNLDLRDGVLDVIPLDRTFDAAGKATDPDNNALPQLGFSAIVTRLGVKFGGIKALGADATGMLETDFFGISNATATTPQVGGTENLLRLRHAYVNLDWKKSSGNTASLLMGQYWNPNFLATNFPGTASFSTGIPFNPFGFMPQVRFTYKFKPGLALAGMLFSYDLAGFSPAGTFPSGTGVDAVKLSTTPAFAAQVSYASKSFFILGGIEGVSLSPKLRDGVDGTNFFGLNYLLTAKYTSKAITVKVYGNYGDLYTQYVGLGGFVGYTDSTTGKSKYQAVKQMNLWGEIIFTKGKLVQPALFVGYADNLGLSNPINMTKDIKSGTMAIYGRQIGTVRMYDNRMYDNFLRISPRVDFYSGKLKLSIEYEASIANYATSDYTATNTAFSMKANADATTANAFQAVNHRILLLMVYNF